MWELFKRFGLINQVSLVIVAVVVLGVFIMIVVMSPVEGTIMVVIFTAITVFCFWFFFASEARRFNLLKRGEPAEATILEVKETGITIQKNYPVAKLLLEVRPREGEPYQEWVKCMVNRFDIPTYQPGAVVQVMVDPRNRKKVAVVP
jgi:hypothetical protein